MTLMELKFNETAIINRINSNAKRRLLDLGLSNGTKIKAVLNNLSGNLRAYEVRGTLIAIRNEDSKKIEIKSWKKRIIWYNVEKKKGLIKINLVLALILINILVLLYQIIIEIFTILCRINRYDSGKE